MVADWSRALQRASRSRRKRSGRGAAFGYWVGPAERDGTWPRRSGGVGAVSGEFGHTYAVGEGWHVDTWGSGSFVIEAGGKQFRFEDSDRFGPALINMCGDPLANPWPPERSPFWAAHRAWVKQGRRTTDGITCVYEPLKPTKVRHIRRRQYLVVEHGDEGGPTVVVP